MVSTDDLYFMPQITRRDTDTPEQPYTTGFGDYPANITGAWSLLATMWMLSTITANGDRIEFLFMSGTPPANPDVAATNPVIFRVHEYIAGAWAFTTGGYRGLACNVDPPSSFPGWQNEFSPCWLSPAFDGNRYSGQAGIYLGSNKYFQPSGSSPSSYTYGNIATSGAQDSQSCGFSLVSTVTCENTGVPTWVRIRSVDASGNPVVNGVDLDLLGSGLTIAGSSGVYSMGQGNTYPVSINLSMAAHSIWTDPYSANAALNFATATEGAAPIQTMTASDTTGQFPCTAPTGNIRLSAACAANLMSFWLDMFPVATSQPVLTGYNPALGQYGRISFGKVTASQSGATVTLSMSAPTYDELTFSGGNVSLSQMGTAAKWPFYQNSSQSIAGSYGMLFFCSPFGGNAIDQVYPGNNNWCVTSVDNGTTLKAFGVDVSQTPVQVINATAGELSTFAIAGTVSYSNQND